MWLTIAVGDWVYIVIRTSMIKANEQRSDGSTLHTTFQVNGSCARSSLCVDYRRGVVHNLAPAFMGLA